VERTLQVLNDLERTGVLGRYAIGGAMGAAFYVEPFLTFDLDIFVVLPQTETGMLTLSPIYEALRNRSYKEEGECVVIEGIPVQFIPAYSPLLEEALTEAVEMNYEQTPTRVFRAEHLIAVCLQTGREKDRLRVRLMREQAELNGDYLTAIIERHHLKEIWERWTA